MSSPSIRIPGPQSCPLKLPMPPTRAMEEAVSARRDVLEASNPLLLRWLIVAAAMIGSVLEMLDTSITNVAVPQMMGNLGATLSEIGWVSTGYIISNVIILPMTGWLADRFGRRNYFTAAILLFTAASLACGLSHSLGELIFWRVVQG